MKLSTGLTPIRIPDLSGITGEQKQHCITWIEALRSDQYKQGRNALRRLDDSFCCLGVGCDVAANAGLGEWVQLPYHTGPDSALTFSAESVGTTGMLPPAVQDYYGIKNSFVVEFLDDESEKGLGYSTFMGLNDGFGSRHATFPDIALIIETAINGGLNPFSATDEETSSQEPI